MKGRLLGGRYRIEGPLGGGGMAVVYLGRDQLLDRMVAVKMLRPEFVGDEAFVERFKLEAKAAARLSHPNIVAIYDVGRDDGLDYIVMEYVSGQTLKERIKAAGPLPPREAVDIAVQVLAALEHAHSHGVIHRDIKPQNILLAESGQVKVADFGIARAVGTQTLTDAGPIMGSAHYVSPEQASGKPTGARTDLYSLGVVLFEMLTGVLPFDGESMVTVAVKHMREEPPDPHALASQVSPTLSRIVLQALQKDPQRRYPSARVMRKDLENFAVMAPEEVWAVPDDQPTVNLSALGVPGNGGAAAAVAAPQSGREAPRPGPEARPARRRAGAKRRQRPWSRILAMWTVALVVMGGLVGFTAQAVGSWLKPPVVTVPEVTGLDQGTARSQLAAAGVALRVVAERHDDQMASGLVLEQNPGPGATMRRGGVVEVIMSLGPQLVHGGMIDVRGERAAAAELRLKQLGLAVEYDYVHHSEAPEGTVVAQDPTPATPVRTGTVVRLTVSRGPEGEPIALPDLRGLTVARARDELASMKLRVGEIRTAPGDYPPDTIGAHEPAAGEVVPPGTAVVLYVSSGNGIEPNETMFPVTLPGEPAEQQIEVRVIDERGERLVYRGRHGGGVSFTVPVYWYGEEATVTVQSNGQLLTVEEIW